MGALVGRKVFIYKGSETSPAHLVAAARTKSLSLSAEPIDITTDDDSGLRTLLESDAGQKSAELSVEGVAKNANFIDALTSDQFVDEYTIEIDGIGVFNGRFFLASTSVSAPYNDAVTFSAEFQSTGAWTFTPASGA